MNHTRFPKEDHLPDWARRDNKVTKGDRVEYISKIMGIPENVYLRYNIFHRQGDNAIDAHAQDFMASDG